ncbi:ABC transporter permease [Streptomyces sp. NPDC057611]|uniref:ABC transporter permease n=1 Tax=Streptomyces sp. NPDC057611 TaxID=3346182 RepID=UPI00368C25A3
MSFLIDALSVAVVLSTPLVYAALGELIAERAGVMNLGVEGMMLVGAVSGFVVAVRVNSFTLAFLVAALAGAALALVHAVMSITLGVNQVVMGLTLTVLGTGLSSYIGSSFGDERLKGSVGTIPIPLLSDIPGVGEVLFRHDLLVYLAPVTVAGSALLINRTRVGLWLRAAGEAPAAADAAGVPVFAVRYAAVTIGGVLAGVAGAYLSLVYVGSWSDQMTAGRGWIALALVIFASWRPVLLLPGALLFGFIDALNFQLQLRGVSIPSPYLSMMPYVFTLVALTIVWTRQRARHWGMPEALGIPYEREARS